jgi:hypothetical protein
VNHYFFLNTRSSAELICTSLTVTKKSIRNWIIVAAITALYLVYVSQTAISCFIAKQAFVNNGQTQKTIFAAIFVSPLWGTFVDDICYYLMAQISDGLLVWNLLSFFLMLPGG